MISRSLLLKKVKPARNRQCDAQPRTSEVILLAAVCYLYRKMNRVSHFCSSRPSAAGNEMLLRCLLAIIGSTAISVAAASAPSFFAESIAGPPQDTTRTATVDSLYRKVQFSLLPGLGTNGDLSDSAINGYSFNFLGGRSAGLKKAEFGLGFNTVTDTLWGVQFALGINKARHVKSGAQMALIANRSKGSMKGFQAALFNRAHVAEGVQLGFINVADSIKGTPVGFLSFVGTGGYKSVDLAFDETFRLNASFATGMRHFYNLITVGASQRQEGDAVWYAGYGVGTSPMLGERLAVNVQLTANYLMHSGESRFNLLNRLGVGLEYLLGGRVSAFAHGMINGLLHNDDFSFPGYTLPQRREPLVREQISDDRVLQVYPGMRFGLRLNW